MMDKPKFSLKTFFKEHTVLAVSLLLGFLLIISIVIAIVIANNNSDGVVGTNSRDYEASVAEDQKAINQTDAFKIINYLPLTSSDPSYEISYLLEKDSAGNYSLKLTLNAFSAFARDAMVKRLLTENFGDFDPLDYELVLENYYNPFTNSTLDDLKAGNYPPGFAKSNLYSFGDTNYKVQTLTHTLYDGSTNTYRFILENDEPKTKPQLLFTYKDLDFLDKSIVKSLNNLE